MNYGGVFQKKGIATVKGARSVKVILGWNLDKAIEGRYNLAASRRHVRSRSASLFLAFTLVTGLTQIPLDPMCSQSFIQFDLCPVRSLAYT